jgi:hypothetical protein
MRVTGNKQDDMHDLDLIDETLDIHNVTLNQLSIQTSLNGFSFCITDLQKRKHVALRHYSLPGDGTNLDIITSILKLDDLLQNQYKQVLHLTVTQRQCMVPTKWYEKKEIETYLSHITPPLFPEEFIELSPVSDGSLVHTNPKGLEKLISTKFPSTVFTNQGKLFLQVILDEYWQKPRAQVFAYIMPDHMQIAVTVNGRLQFYNMFSCPSPDDVLYYLLLVFKKEKLDTQLTELNLVSNFGEQLTDEISSQIKHTKVLKEKNDFTWSYRFKEVDMESYQYLFTLSSLTT